MDIDNRHASRDSFVRVGFGEEEGRSGLGGTNVD
jgi:hypothetical protein